MKKYIKKILKSQFIKDKFILSVIVFWFIFNLIFFYFIKLNKIFSGENSSFIDTGYDFAYSDNVYNLIFTSVIIFIFNLLISRLVYYYDILASYIAIVAVPFFILLYFVAMMVFLSSGANF